MKELLTKTKMINSYEVDFKNRLRPDNIFRYFQQIAYEHSNKLNFGYKQLLEKNIIWVLSRMKIKIDKYPKWNNKIKIKTWPKALDRLFALRDFVVINEQGEEIIKATSYWLMLNIKRKRPIRISKKFKNFRYMDNKHALQDKLTKLNMDYEFDKIIKEAVKYSDIDVNNHVNNARYIEWVFNNININKLKNKKAKTIEAHFLSEMDLNSNYKIKIKNKNNENNSLIYDLNKDKKAFASRITFG